MGLLTLDSDGDSVLDDREGYERKRKAEQARRNATNDSGSGPSPDPLMEEEGLENDRSCSSDPP